MIIDRDAASTALDPKDIPALRQRVKMMELEAERLQQEVLHSSWPVDKLGVAAPADEAARANIQAYGAILGARLDTDAVDLLLAAFAKDLSSPAESKTL